MGTLSRHWSLALMACVFSIVTGCGPDEQGTAAQNTEGQDTEAQAEPAPLAKEGYPRKAQGMTTSTSGAKYYLSFTDDIGLQSPDGITDDDGNLRKEIASLKEVAGLATDKRDFVQYDSRGVGFVKAAEGKEWGDIAEAVRKQEAIKVKHVGMAATLHRGEEPRTGEPVVVVLPEFVVRFRSDVDGVEMGKKDGCKAEKVPFAPNQYILKAKSPSEALKLCDKYRAKKDAVIFAEPNLIRPRELRQPDPLLQKQWHLINKGQSGGLNQADVNATVAWKETKGSPHVLIAVLDPQGVELSHEDLQPNQYRNVGEFGPDGTVGADGTVGWKQSNGLDDDGNGYPDDFSGWNFGTNDNAFRPGLQQQGDPWVRGIQRDDDKRAGPAALGAHGTAAAGLAAACGDNGIGVSGLAPKCRLLGITMGVTDQDDADAFYYAADQGADVISCSWGYSIGVPATQLVEQAITDVANPGEQCQGRHGLGCVVVFAMTNENIDNFGDADDDSVIDISSHPDVIAVGRSTNKDKWGFSGFGDGMHLLAPSQAAKGTSDVGCDRNDLVGTLDITTTDLTGTAGYNSGKSDACFCNNDSAKEIGEQPNYTSCFGGTSASAPLVAGAAALCLSVRPHATSIEIREDLTSTAFEIEKSKAQYDNNGYSRTHGHGRLDAGEAVLESKMRAKNDSPKAQVLKRQLIFELQRTLFTLSEAKSQSEKELKLATEALLKELQPSN